MWQGVQGHDEVVDHFRRSLAAGRLASSFLFLGLAGVGKRSLAEKLAQALLCQAENASALDPCGTCESCRLAEAGNHPDIDLVALPVGKRWLAVDQFLGDRNHRNQTGMCHNLSMRPMLGRRRVAIIDDADHLTVESANCLLKTLEEPPPGAVLILIGTSRGRQLPTILSRTQTVRFRPLPTEVIAELLLEQGLANDPAQAAELAAASEGSLRRAAEQASPSIAELRQTLLPQFEPTKFDSVTLAAQLGQSVSKAGKEAEARRQHLRSILRMTADYFRQKMLAEASQQTDQSSRLAAIERCLEAEIELDRNANQTTLLECWLDDLAEILLPQQSATDA